MSNDISENAGNWKLFLTEPPVLTPSMCLLLLFVAREKIIISLRPKAETKEKNLEMFVILCSSFYYLIY